jgi:hypothetical protein
VGKGHPGEAPPRPLHQRASSIEKMLTKKVSPSYERSRLTVSPSYKAWEGEACLRSHRSNSSTAAKPQGRPTKAKKARDDLVAAAFRAQADALEIEALAKRRLPDI